MATTAPIILPIETPGLKKLQDLEKRMAQLEKEVNKVNKALPVASNNIKRTGKAALTATGNIQRFGVAFRTTALQVVTFYGAVRVLSSSLKTMGSREADVNALANGLKKFTGDGTAALAALQKQADKFGDSTLFNQEDFTKGAALLTSFTDIAVKDYNRVINVASDLATLNGGAVKDSLLQVAKALNAPSQNLSALSRSGIQFTEQQKEQIKALEASGQKLEAQNLILKELTVQYGGAAKAAATGFAGAVDTLGENFRDFSEALGKVIEPLATDLVNGLATVFEIISNNQGPLLKFIEVIASGLEIVFKNFKTILKAILGFGAAVAAFKVVGAAIAALSKATAIWAGTVKAVAAAKATLMALLNPATIAQSLVAVGVGIGVYKGLGEAIDGAINSVENSGEAGSESNKEFAKLAKTLEGLKFDYQGAGNAAAEAAQKMKIATRQAEQLQKANSQERIGLQFEEAFLNNRQKLTDAYYSAELKIVELQKQRAQQAGDILGVYQAEVKQAQLVYLQTVAQIKAEVEKAAIKVRQLQLQTKELKVKLLLKKAAGDLKEEERLAYQEQLAAVKIAQGNLEVSKRIAAEQERGARAVYNASVEAARYGYNQAYVAQQAERTATAQQRSARALERQAKASRGGGGGAGGSGSGDTWMIEGELYTFQGSKTASTGGATIINKSHPFASTAPSHLWGASKPEGYAEGGYINGPTNALLGEGGESEYVIPSSKMDSAMARYARGARGAAVTEGGGQKNSRGGGGSVVNVNTGPVMRMNNKDYVTVSDLTSALGSVASAMDGSSGNYGGSARVG